MRAWSLLIALMCLLTPPSLAQSEGENDDFSPAVEAIEADRPIIIRVPDLENNHQQIELDLLVNRSRDGTPIRTRFPILYRIDTGPDTEFRLQSDFLTIKNPNVGFGDISVGFKWQAGPRTSLIGFLEVPTGSAGFADPGLEPTLILAQDLPISDRWGLGVNAGISFNRDASTKSSTPPPSLATISRRPPNCRRP